MSDKRKVAVCGTAPSSLGEAPFDDPEWEIWGTSRLWKQTPRQDLWVEIHPPDEIGRGWNCTDKERRDQREEHLDWMAQADCPVYMQREYDRVPGSIRYPKEEIREYLEEEFGDTAMYFTNSISWMLALALYMEVGEVGIWGVDMALDEEYSYQRPSVEYWLGLLRGAGIEVHVPDSCDLLHTSHLYGYEWDEGERFIRKLDARLDELSGRQENAKNRIQQLAQVRAAAGAVADNVGEILENGHELPGPVEREMEVLVQEGRQQAKQAEQQIQQLQVKRERLAGAKDNVEYIKRSFANSGIGGGSPEVGEMDADVLDFDDFNEVGVAEAARGG